MVPAFESLNISIKTKLKNQKHRQGRMHNIQSLSCCSSQSLDATTCTNPEHFHRHSEHIFFYSKCARVLLINTLGLVWGVGGGITVSPLFLHKTKLKEQLLSAQSEHKPIRSAACRADGLTVDAHKTPLFSLSNCKHSV